MVTSAAAVDEIIIQEMDEACLNSVLTVREASALYHKTSKGITDAIKAKRLIGRQARPGSIWLVTKRSLDELWGAS